MNTICIPTKAVDAIRTTVVFFLTLPPLEFGESIWEKILLGLLLAGLTGSPAALAGDPFGVEVADFVMVVGRVEEKRIKMCSRCIMRMNLGRENFEGVLVNFGHTSFSRNTSEFEKSF